MTQPNNERKVDNAVVEQISTCLTACESWPWSPGQHTRVTRLLEAARDEIKRLESTPQIPKDLVLKAAERDNLKAQLAAVMAERDVLAAKVEEVDCLLDWLPVKHLPTVVHLAKLMIEWKRMEDELFQAGSFESQRSFASHKNDVALKIQDLTAQIAGHKPLDKQAISQEGNGQ